MRPFAASRPRRFGPIAQIIDDFKATVRYVITRKNVYTGVAYRDEPAIFGWETGNEIDSTPEWTREIAAYIKELDPNHLVIDGRSLHGVPLTSLDDPNIDVITTHHYPWGDDHDFTKPIRAAHALTKGKKPYFVGEFGFVETPHIAAAIQAVIDDGISGALLWSLRMHRREGGFYWHMEVGTGRNIYKAFHWPGFASGDRYDERVVMQLMREKAHEIRGLEPPPLELPRPPKLLPIERVSAISWQGSAGAESYDVWRAETWTDNPVRPGTSTVLTWHRRTRLSVPAQWTKIANDVGRKCNTARFLTMTSGARQTVLVSCHGSECSRRIGAVERRRSGDRSMPHAGRRMPGSLPILDAIEGEVAVATENARTVQEDCHRFAMQPGAAVIYRVAAAIDRCANVFSFVRDACTPSLKFRFQRMDNEFRPLRCKQHEV